jgi:inner membrane protein involved in colicin E2 resistance
MPMPDGRKMKSDGYWRHLRVSNFQLGIEMRNAACNQRFLEGKAVVQITAIEIAIDYLLRHRAARSRIVWRNSRRRYDHWECFLGGV